MNSIDKAELGLVLLFGMIIAFLSWQISSSQEKNWKRFQQIEKNTQQLYPVLVEDTLDNRMIIYVEWDSLKEYRIEKLRTILDQKPELVQ